MALFGSRTSRPARLKFRMQPNKCWNFLDRLDSPQDGALGLFSRVCIGLGSAGSDRRPEYYIPVLQCAFMKRTRISLSDEHAALIEATGKGASEIIQEALSLYFQQDRKPLTREEVLFAH